jgi:MinD-like ATPase involved in chromosome partitioning or flagellar assembly
LASSGQQVLLVDADTYGGSVAQSLGLPEHPSLLVAVHAAATGLFGPEHLGPLLHAAGEGLWVLPGVSDAARWPEVREASFLAVLDAARAEFAVTVVDGGFCLEEDEELAYDGVPLRRNLATRVAVREADCVIAVCRADPVGLRRFLAARAEFESVIAGASVTVVNRSPATVAGRRKMEMSLTLERHTGAPPISFVPDDVAVAECLWEGTCVVRSRPRAPAARALATLAREVGAKAEAMS